MHVLDASAGGAHTAVVGTDGRAYTCGLNDHAQLGHSPSSPFVPILTPVDGLPDHDPIVSVSAGHHHTLCVTAGGELWAFGRNDAGQCGVGADAPRVISAPAWIAALSPDAPGNAGAGAIVSVAAGPRHSIAVTSEGAAYAWGAAEGASSATATTPPLDGDSGRDRPRTRPATRSRSRTRGCRFARRASG